MLNRLVRVPVFFAFLFFLPLSAFAQETVTISGIVKESDSGETLPYAHVLVLQSTIGAATNIDGRFVLLDVPSGEQVLRVSFLGFQTKDVPVNTNEVLGPLIIELDPISTDLNEVVVVADSYSMMKTSEKAGHITISPKDLAVLPSIGDVDIFRSLQLLPGISGTNEGSSGLFVRGGTPDQNLVLLDGMTVYHVDHFFGFFSAFNADAIKDVQVFKGGFPAKYGGRTSSVVDLAGKTGDVNKIRTGIGINMLSANAVVQIPMGGKGSFLVSGRRSFTDILRSGLYNNIYETLTGDDITTEGVGGGSRGGGALRRGAAGLNRSVVQPDFYFYDLKAKLSYRPTDRDALSISFYSGQDDLDKSNSQTRTPTTATTNVGSVTNDITDLTNWGNIGISSTWYRQWSPRLFSNIQGAFSRYFSDYSRQTDIERIDSSTDSVSFARNFGTDESNRVNDISLRMDNEWQLSQQSKLDFGFHVTHSNVSYNLVRDDFLTILDRDQNALQTAVYVQNSWNPVPSLKVSSGLRGIYYDATQQRFLEPRLSLSYDLSSLVTLKSSWGRFNQFVARVVNENVTEGARDFWLIADGNTVSVNSSEHYIVGASFETRDWLLDVEAYKKDTSDLTEFSLRYQGTTGRGPLTTVSGEADELFFTGDGIAKGLEILLQNKTGRHTGWISYTLANVAHTFPELNDGEPFPPLHDQRHEIKLVNSWRFGKVNLASTWTFGSGKPYTAPESQYFLTLLDGTEQSFIHVGEKNAYRLPAYHRLDLSAHLLLEGEKSNVDIGFSLFNVYNRSNVWYQEFDLSETPLVTTDYTFLGITPNLSLRVDF